MRIMPLLYTKLKILRKKEKNKNFYHNMKNRKNKQEKKVKKINSEDENENENLNEDENVNEFRSPRPVDQSGPLPF